MELFVGKLIRGDLYVHESATTYISKEARQLLDDAIELWDCDEALVFNVIKIGRDLQRVSFLNYPGFFTEAFPALKGSCSINPSQKQVVKRVYSGVNPPILHRKELMLPDTHPSRKLFLSLTESLKAYGASPTTSSLGFKLGWEQHLVSLGIDVVGHVVKNIEAKH